MRGILSGLIRREEAAQVTYLIQLATVNNIQAVRHPDEPSNGYMRTLVDPDPILPPVNQIADPEEAQRATHRDGVYQNGMEFVMVRPREDMGNKLVPMHGFESASLDRFDQLRNEPPAPDDEEDEQEEEDCAPVYEEETA